MISNKKVTVSCGTKFHSDYMGYQLEKHGLLEKVITSHPPSKYFGRVNLSRSKVTFLPPFFAALTMLNRVIDKNARFNKWLGYKLPYWYDRIAAYFLGNSNVLIVWAWAGLNTIKKIKEKGGIAIIEECGSCNKFQNAILTEEYETLGLTFRNKTPEHIVERELEEIRMADYVLCPSRHVAESFVNYGVLPEKCVIIPYGVNLELFKSLPNTSEKFSILFVGTVGVRKGLIYLFKALELLHGKIDVQCTVIGMVEKQFEPVFNQYKHLFTHIPRVPHHDLIKYYNDASVFVFPSLDEGMAYVQLEAMACGLPVISTPNSGGDSVLEDGIDGFIVPIRQAEAIAEKIKYLYNNKDVLNQMSLKAQVKAATFTWDNYGEKLAKLIEKV